MINGRDIDEYIAGLWEGDGHLIIMSEKTHQFTFAITFNKNNEKLANYILSYIGYGYLREKKRENALVLMIGNLKGLTIITKIINGKLRTPKINKFNKLIDWLNLKNNNEIIKKYEKNTNKILNDSWFCGFTEADGCFDIRITEGKEKSRIAFRYRLDQRMYDPITKESYESILNMISTAFNTKLKIVNKKQGSYYHISITSQESLIILIEYFQKYNLLGVKSLDYTNWYKGYKLYQERIKITPELIKELKEIKYQMNSRRTDFNIPLIL